MGTGAGLFRMRRAGLTIVNFASDFLTEPSTFSPASVYTGGLKGKGAMSEKNGPQPSYFSQIDVFMVSPTPLVPSGAAMYAENDRSFGRAGGQDRKTNSEEWSINWARPAATGRGMGQWKQANPGLARSCRMAAEALSRIQTEYLETLTEEIGDNFETLRDGEFMLNEFVDRFGPRIAHLNGLLQVLSQLSATPDPSSSPHRP